LLARDDAGEVWLFRIAGVLESASLPEWAVRVREKLARSNPVREQLTLDWARALHRLGRTAEARGVIETLALRGAINDEISGKIAPLCVELGDRNRARQLFAQALRNDPFVRNYTVWLDFARLQLADKNLAGARRTLRAAYSNPANRDFAPLIAWLAAADRLEKAEAELAEFDLSPSRLTDARRALFVYFEDRKKLAAAIALIQEHPETLTAPIAAALRKLAKSEQRFEEVAAIFDATLKQQPAGSELSAELARLLGDWAASEVAAGRIDPALGHLRRAHELRPEIFEVARDLAVLQSQNAAGKSAIETLESYLAAALIPAEAAKAQEMLAKLKAGGRL
ncbi:MAG TPA: tetratricopeptide repeat protein, partial [Chthoniobacteraceae bacterium]|nr:tetratricopeptide repeat protein [Chthoniobacteraceae bacterium]